jgi:hypothetical protein
LNCSLRGLSSLQHLSPYLSKLCREVFVALAREPRGIDFRFQQDRRRYVGAALRTIFLVHSGQPHQVRSVTANATLRSRIRFTSLWAARHFRSPKTRAKRLRVRIDARAAVGFGRRPCRAEMLKFRWHLFGGFSGVRAFGCGGDISRRRSIGRRRRSRNHTLEHRQSGIC